MRLSCRLLSCLLALLLAAAPALGGDEVPSKGRLRKSVRSALGESRPIDRAQALQDALRGLDHGSVADILVRDVLAKSEDRAQAVIQTALVLLGRMRDDGALDVLRSAASKGELPQRALAIEALGRQERLAARDVLLPLLDAPEPAIRAATASALGRIADDPTAEFLLDHLDDPTWQVRSAVIDALRRVGYDGVVPQLIERAKAERGRLLDDLFVALRSLTGESYGDDLEAYAEWWRAKEGAGTAEPLGFVMPPASFEHERAVTRSRRILFVLAAGRSMADELQAREPAEREREAFAAHGDDLAEALVEVETRLELAQVHLRRMLRSLADGVEFDVMVVSSSPTRVFGEFQAASGRTREKAEQRIESLSPSAYADLPEALHHVFAPRGRDPWDDPDGPDTVVLLSDGALGEPGKVDPLDAGARVARWNAVRQIRFLVLGVGQADVSALAGLTTGPPLGTYAELR